MPLLEVTDLRTGYGNIPVLHGVSFSVEEGETAVMLGLNGAGKTTTLMCIAGLLDTWSGSIRFDGEEIADAQADELVQRGLVLVPEGRHVFPALTVEQNLKLGAWGKRGDAAAYRENLARVLDLFPRLGERRTQLAGTLSGGEQQMVAVGRGLMAGPRLLLIDEASLGLSPRLAQQVFKTIARIAEEGITVILVGQSAGALRIADRAFIMEKGRIVREQTGSEMLGSDELRRAYLGAPA